MDLLPALARWLHFLAGVMWIGLLYYFNFVQVAALKAATADGTAAGITKHVAPRALLYFRWAAVVTWIAGAALLGNQFLNAFTLSKGMAGIGVGAWLHHHVVQCLGIDLAQSAKDPWPQAGNRRRKGYRPARGIPCLAHQCDVVDSNALFHGRRLVAPGDIRPLGRDVARRGARMNSRPQRSVCWRYVG